MNTNKSKTRGMLQLLLAIFIGWVLFFVASPLLVESIPALKHYGEVQDRHNVRSGLMYYTDLPTSQETEMNIYDALTYGRTPPPNE